VSSTHFGERDRDWWSVCVALYVHAFVHLCVGMCEQHAQ